MSEISVACPHACDSTESSKEDRGSDRRRVRVYLTPRISSQFDFQSEPGIAYGFELVRTLDHRSHPVGGGIAVVPSGVSHRRLREGSCLP